MGAIMRTMTVRIDDELDDRLGSLAHDTGRTKSYYARQALLEFLEEREDYILGVASLERKGKTITLGELERELGMAD
jgi:RHH-type transcriptional regulator, rel operon repressor / antitoxin RelB